ncbi:MAG: phosphate/phosphite/phosphonate ABC transporter substrate-binding protein [Nitrospiraceae bacterium]|nr:phosphate/phosphite/phosphonate ABC transporter substrate-binding protein [Nitrospiraceae bacterium]
MKRLLVVVIGITAFLTAACTTQPGKSPSTRVYRIGYMICNSEQETLHRFKPLTAYLEKKLGVRLEMQAIDTTDFTKAVDTLDFTHTNSLLYIMMHRNQGVDILAAEKAGSLGARAKGLVVALKKSGITNLRQLKGRTMVFGPMLGPTSYMAQLDLLLKSGIDPENDLASYAIPPGTFKHEKVIYGVMLGKYDAGAAPLLDFERMAADGRIDPKDFTVLAESEPIPYCNFGVTQKVDEGLARRFKQAVLALTKNDTVEVDGETVRVLERANVDGYDDILDKYFDSVREMAKRTNMPPYQRL